MTFGRKMLEFRAKHNLTQKQLAEIICIDKNTVHRTETEKTTPTLRNQIMIENKMRKWEEKQNENVSL